MARCFIARKTKNEYHIKGHCYYEENNQRIDLTAWFGKMNSKEAYLDMLNMLKQHIADNIYKEDTSKTFVCKRIIKQPYVKLGSKKAR